MTISRMQQPRQLYGLGSLVKKITRPIKQIVKSPLGKAALGAAALYGVNRFGIPGTSGFVGEFLVLLGIFQKNYLKYFQIKLLHN